MSAQASSNQALQRVEDLLDRLSAAAMNFQQTSHILLSPASRLPTLQALREQQDPEEMDAIARQIQSQALLIREINPLLANVVRDLPEVRDIIRRNWDLTTQVDNLQSQLQQEQAELSRLQANEQAVITERDNLATVIHQFGLANPADTLRHLSDESDSQRDLLNDVNKSLLAVQDTVNDKTTQIATVVQPLLTGTISLEAGGSHWTLTTLNNILRALSSESTEDPRLRKSPRRIEPERRLSSPAVLGPRERRPSRLSLEQVQGEVEIETDSPETPQVAEPVLTRPPLDITQVQTDRLRNVFSIADITLARQPLKLITEQNLRVGNGTEDVANYPAVPEGLTDAILTRLETQLKAIFCQTPDDAFDRGVRSNPQKSRGAICLYRRTLEPKSGLSESSTDACEACRDGNRFCIRKLQGTEGYSGRSVAFLAPLPGNDRRSLGPDDIRYWIANPDKEFSRSY